MISKALLMWSFFALAFLSIGTMLMPNNPVFWLASSEPTLQLVRLVLGIIVIGQLSTNPPRHLWFRLLAGTVSAFVAVWALQQTYASHMSMLDSLAFLGTSIAVFITALERHVLLSKSPPATDKAATA